MRFVRSEPTMRAMGVIEFEIERSIAAPIQDVFARLADIEGHNEWMPSKGSILARTQQTSPGAPGLGTTYLDKTSFGSTPGEIVEFEPPHLLAYKIVESRPLKLAHDIGRMRLTAQGGRTELLWETTFAVRVPLIGGPLTYVVRFAMQRTFSKILPRSMVSAV